MTAHHRRHHKPLEGVIYENPAAYHAKFYIRPKNTFHRGPKSPNEFLLVTEANVRSESWSNPDGHDITVYFRKALLEAEYSYTPFPIPSNLEVFQKNGREFLSQRQVLTK